MASFFDTFLGKTQKPVDYTGTPTQNYNSAYSNLIGQLPNVQAYNQGLQPIVTGSQLANQNQIFGPSANKTQQEYYNQVLGNLQLGNTVSPEMQDLITTNTLQGNARSGLTGSQAGNLFGARSLLSAGLDLGAQRRQEAAGAINLLPSTHFQYQPQGLMDINQAVHDVAGYDAQRANQENIRRQVESQNSQLALKKGAEIVGMVAGGVAGYYSGNIAGGVAGGGEFGRRLFSGSGVAGYENLNGPKQEASSGGGGNPFSSLLSGLGGIGGNGSSRAPGGNYGFPKATPVAG